MIKMRRFLTGAIVLFLFAALTVTALAAEQNNLLFKDIEGSLMCTDDCGMPLASCDNATAVQMRADIRRMLDEGMGKNDILQSYINIYGIEVLTYPPKKGFNLTAWVMPFVGILGGGLVIYLALDKWILAKEESEAQEGTEEKIDELELKAYDSVLADEQKRYW